MPGSHVPVVKPALRDGWSALDALVERVSALMKRYESSNPGGSGVVEAACKTLVTERHAPACDGPARADRPFRLCAPLSKAAASIVRSLCSLARIALKCPVL